MKRLSLRAPLPPLPSWPSLLRRSSSSLGSLCSFPEPWPGAMAELAALTGSGPPRSPKAVEELAGEPGPALGQDPPLELPEATEEERVPGDGSVRCV